uniref:C-C motif chemokine 4 homolog n=1 Tax=Sinocyclocheilus rhinocerous TaxID=307959 RepID=A0A673FLD9_9TELE
MCCKLLTPVFYLFTISASVAHAVPESCCFVFVDFQIPAKRIVSALKTGSNCPVAGIVVKTPRTEFCVKPDEAWIQKVMKKRQK